MNTSGRRKSLRSDGSRLRSPARRANESTPEACDEKRGRACFTWLGSSHWIDAECEISFAL